MGCRIPLGDTVPYSPSLLQGDGGRPQHRDPRNLTAEGAEAPQHSQVRPGSTLPTREVLWVQAARGVFLSFPDCTDRSKINRKMQQSHFPGSQQ